MSTVLDLLKEIADEDVILHVTVLPPMGGGNGLEGVGGGFGGAENPLNSIAGKRQSYSFTHMLNASLQGGYYRIKCIHIPVDVDA